MRKTTAGSLLLRTFCTTMLAAAGLASTAGFALDLKLPASLSDPWDTAASAAPDPATPWRGAIPLQAVPDTLGELPAGLINRPLTLVELTDLALHNNPLTRVAWAAAQADAASVGIARADYLPQVDAQIDFRGNVSSGNGSSRFITSNGTGTGIGAGTGTGTNTGGATGNTDGSGSVISVSNGGSSGSFQTSYGPSISLSYLLLDFGARAAQVQAAEYALLASNLNQNQVIQDVILQVEQAYYQLLGLQALEGANRGSLENAQTNLEAANQRRTAGLATVGDVYQAETAVAQAQLTLTTTQGQVANAQGALANAVATPVNQALTLAPLPADTPIQALTVSVDKLLAQAKQVRPELIAAQAQVGTAQANVKLAASQGRPTLSFTADASESDSLNPVGFNDFSVGLRLRIPLFTGFRTTYTVRQSQAQLEQARASRDDTLNQIELQVWQAYYNQQTAIATITSSDVLLQSAIKAAEVASARYKAGVGTILETLTTQTAEAGARVQSIQAQLNWYIALAQLGHAVGALQPDDISPLTTAAP